MEIEVGFSCELTNVAALGTALQSSTYGDGTAFFAIDGNQEGTTASYNKADLQHTEREDYPWWELDLGSDYLLENLVIYNRSDSNQSRLQNFYVFVSQSPFPDGSSLEELRDNGEVTEYYFGGAAGAQEVIALNSEGRYVRIELSGNGIIHMAEVEIMGCYLGGLPCDGIDQVLISDLGPIDYTDSVQTLVANPVGGTWSGASSDGTFDPGVGPGTYSVTYTYDNGEGCVQTETIELTVNALDSNCELTNVAALGTALQSSTYGDGTAFFAIDGNQEGTTASYNKADLQHTEREDYPWWELDLGSDYLLENLVIYNRSDSNQSRLQNFYVFVSQSPFPDGSSLEELRDNGEVTEYYFGGAAGAQEVIPLNSEGRYVRIELSGNGILHMAEVEIMGCSVINEATTLRASIENADSVSTLNVILLAPNPVSTEIRIMGVSKEMISSVIIFDMEGRQVLNAENTQNGYSNNIQIIDVSKFVKGVYQLNVTLINGEIHTKPFLKKII
ncbi:galactose-binding domain-containing protein [Zobellia nedashkovskayae]